jgi:hypothetical protein
MRQAALLVLFVLVRVSEAFAFTGPVISVQDGDTIEVLHDQHPERIRLHGIDCPEKGQAHGNKAKQATSALVFGKEVTLPTHGKDKYQRTLADVLAYSDPSRPLIPTQVGHPFRRNAATDSDRKSATFPSLLGIGGRHPSE